MNMIFRRIVATALLALAGYSAVTGDSIRYCVPESVTYGGTLWRDSASAEFRSESRLQIESATLAPEK